MKSSSTFQENEDDDIPDVNARLNKGDRSR